MSLSVIKWVCVCVSQRCTEKTNQLWKSSSRIGVLCSLKDALSPEKQVSWILWWWKNLAFAVILGKKNLQNHQRQRSKGFHVWESSPTEPRIDVSFCFWDSPKGNFSFLKATPCHLCSIQHTATFALTICDGGSQINRVHANHKSWNLQKNSGTVDGSEIWQKSYQRWYCSLSI